MSLYEKLIAKEAVLAVVGLGYVGMPIAVAFAKKGLNVIGFDTNSKKIEAYRSGAYAEHRRFSDEYFRSLGACVSALEQRRERLREQWDAFYEHFL